MFQYSNLMYRIFFYIILFFPLTLWAQVKSGPMLGYTEMTEVMIWIQLEKPGTLNLTYWPTNTPKNAFAKKAVVTEGNEGVAKLILTGLNPGTSYSYSFTVDDEWVEYQYPLRFKTLELWQHRNNPPDFTMLTGSCNYANEPEMDRPGEPYGNSDEIFGAMASQSPDMMLWLGDNTYLREPDWNSWSGFVHRYTHTRSQPALQPFLASCPHYSIWDDHDFGPNDANGSFIHKDWSLEAFKLFWANPSYGLPNLESITGQFRFNDVEFFLLDNRTYRVDHQLATSEPKMLGDEQIEWLIQALAYSKASFKIVAVGGQVLNSAKVYENYANYPAERDSLLARLAAEKIHNVVFLTGDRHHSELSKMKIDSVAFYDLTVSPLTSGTYENEEENLHRVEGTKVTKNNFASISFTGPRSVRKMNITIHSSTGDKLWTREIERVK